MKKTIHLSLLFFIFSLSLFSQTKTTKDTIYLDENKKEISPFLFNQKEASAVFYSRNYYTNSTVTYKLCYQYYFGKIPVEKRKELQTLLNKTTDFTIKNDENILIRYFDTLQNYEGKKKIHKNHYKNYHFIVKDKDTIFQKHKALTLKKYTKNAKELNKKSKKCFKKFKYKNTQVIEMYNVNKGYPIGLEPSIWMKDPGIFKENFFINTQEHNFLIIKPNGDFFMKFGRVNDDDLYKLLETNDWTQYVLDWKKSIKKNSITGYGIIKLLYSPYTDHRYNAIPKHCF